MIKIKKIAAIAAAAVMATSIGSTTASAEPLPVEEPMEIILEGDSAVPYKTPIHISYDCSSVQWLGQLVVSSSRVSLMFGEPAVGAVAIKFHTGGYEGPVVQTILPPPAGTTATTLRTSFPSIVGERYFITVEPTGGYSYTRGSFTLTEY